MSPACSEEGEEHPFDATVSPQLTTNKRGFQEAKKEGKMKGLHKNIACLKHQSNNHFTHPHSFCGICS